MTFDEWWKQYIEQGGKSHFNICANEESAKAAWEAAQTDLDRYRKALEDIANGRFSGSFEAVMLATEALGRA